MAFQEFKVDGDCVIDADGAIVYDDLGKRAAELIAQLLTWRSLDAEKIVELKTALEFYGSGADGLSWNVCEIDGERFPFRQDEHANPIPEPWTVADKVLK